ncbi:MAG: T9SS type A sorting domain-containing protein, partial [Crocinitomicaceae bacterium]|nr:T9SS type A sorting domain-containing protein [Crocinitomicaceae bacterium]
LLTDPTYKFATVIPDGNYCSTQAGIEDDSLDSGFMIYPNPAQSVINITQGNFEDESAYILDNSGRIISYIKLTGPTTQHDISMLSSGSYQVCLIKNAQYKRFIIQKD